MFFKTCFCHYELALVENTQTEETTRFKNQDQVKFGLKNIEQKEFDARVRFTHCKKRRKFR